MTNKLTIKDFENEVMNTDRQVLIDFFASWCIPCKLLAPVIDEVAREARETKVFKVDIDEEPDLAERFGVMSIPTLVVMKDGEVLSTIAGVRPKQTILDILSVRQPV